MLKIKITGKFTQLHQQLVVDNLELEELIKAKTKIFQKSPQDTRLRDHALRKTMKGKRAFSITDDIRVVYEKIGVNSVRFLFIGTHPQVYGRKKKS